VREFGYLQPNAIGDLTYVSLIDKVDSANQEFGDVWKTVTWKGNTYFCAGKRIFKYLAATDTVQVIKPAQFGFDQVFFGFVANDRFFLGDYLRGLAEVQGDSVIAVNGGSQFSNSTIAACIPLSENELIIGTQRLGVFHFNLETGEVNDKFINPKLNDILKQSFLYNGIALPSGHFALGTVQGEGCYIFDKDGTLLTQLDERVGISNHTITSIYMNQRFLENSPLWLTSFFGISKIEINSPFRFFAAESGLTGNINDIIKFRDVIYIATVNGVYYMVEDDFGYVKFEKVEGINDQGWSFLRFKGDGSIPEKLLVGTESGLFELTRSGGARKLTDRVAERRFYTLKVIGSEHDPNKIYLGLNDGFATLIYERRRWELEGTYTSNEEIRSIVEDDEGNLFASTVFGGIIKFAFTENGDTVINRYSVENGLPTPNENYAFKFDEGILFATQGGIYEYEEEADRFVPSNFLGPEYSDSTLKVFRIVKDSDGDFWMSLARENEGSFELFVEKEGDNIITHDLPFKRLTTYSTDAIYPDENGIVWFGKANELFRYDKSYAKDFTIPYQAQVRRVVLDIDSVIFNGAYFRRNSNGNLIVDSTQPEELKYSIKHDHNNVTFYWAAPFFEAEEATEYRYWLEGNDREWTRWSDRTEFTYTNLSRKDYTFHVQARNVYGIESEIGTFEFTILPPWYQTIIAYIVYFILAITFVVVIVKLYTRRLIMENLRLEGIVAERTAEVVRQKEELTDSIEYASRIQRALLPSEKILFESLPKHFILFKPRDIVSGDFYWMTHKENKVFICAADCTGHGVPGAFMSMLGISFLNEIVIKSGITESNLILDELRKHVMESLKQTGEGEDETKDGMDLSLSVIDKERRRIQFSGAYNPLIYVRPLTDKEKKMVEKGEELDVPQGALYNENYMLDQLKGDKMPIGISSKKYDPFTLNELDMKPGWSMYMYSDGFVDQFGGPAGKKFMSKAFKKLLLEVQDYPMKEQGKILDDTLLQWKGDLPQVDDIIVIGIELD
jgi:serine phosphatase RsbU (regulator of sigma subunit)